MARVPREREATGRLRREARDSAVRLQCVFGFIQNWIEDLDLPEDRDRLTGAVIALLRVEREAQRQFPGLTR
jgi:hypothetical protein